MKILITGATGLIGQAFIKHYAHLHNFHVVSRSADTVNQAFHHEIQQGVLERVDLTLLNDLNAYDAVINLAGEAILGISQNLELLADVALIGAIAGFGR